LDCEIDFVIYCVKKCCQASLLCRLGERNTKPKEIAHTDVQQAVVAGALLGNGVDALTQTACLEKVTVEACVSCLLCKPEAEVERGENASLITFQLFDSTVRVAF